MPRLNERQDSAGTFESFYNFYETPRTFTRPYDCICQDPRTLQHSTAQSRSLLPPSNMESSRIYIRNLPPGVTNEEFRKHFSMGGIPLTDSKVIPQRRIGYIGFKSPQDAARAVKYFNKTFIRTSRIGVELARSVGKGRCCRKKPSEQGHTDIMSSG